MASPAVPLEIFIEVLYTLCSHLPGSTHQFIHLETDVSHQSSFISISPEADEYFIFSINSV